MAWVKSAEFARIAGVSRACITQRCKEGALVRTPAGKLDTESPVNKAFITKQREKGKKSKANLVSAKETAAAKKITIPRNSPLSNRVIQAEQESEEILIKGIENAEFLESILSGEAVIDDLEHISKTSIDRLKTIEQIKDLRIKTELSRNKLIPRELVSRVFSKLYAIDINEFKTLGPAISQDIIPLVGIVEENQIMAIGEMVDKHLRKVLQHIKRIIDDFLKTLEEEIKDG
jgi:ribosomal protein S13